MIPEFSLHQRRLKLWCELHGSQACSHISCLPLRFTSLPLRTALPINPLNSSSKRNNKTFFTVEDSLDMCTWEPLYFTRLWETGRYYRSVIIRRRRSGRGHTHTHSTFVRLVMRRWTVGCVLQWKCLFDQRRCATRHHLSSSETNWQLIQDSFYLVEKIRVSKRLL